MEGRKEGREKGRIRKGKWFSRRGESGLGRERGRDSSQERNGGEEEVVRRAGVQEELERSEE